MKFITTGAIAALLLVAALAVSCGDGDGGALSLEEYFQALDQEDNDVRFAELSPEPGASDEEFAAFFQGAVRESAQNLRDWQTALDDLEPPDEAEDAHNELLAVIAAFADALQAIADDLPDNLSMAELEQLKLDQTDLFMEFPELSAAFIRVGEACTALQQIASDNSIDVELGCSEWHNLGT